MDLSIVIPVYNTAQSDLSRCFASVLWFDGIDHEVIIVDDGSEKETEEFCRIYARDHMRFRYIRQQNKGVSAARNEGLRQAEGDYILFVDSDDEVVPHNLQRQHLNSNAQIIFFDFESIEFGRSKRWGQLEQEGDLKWGKKDFFSMACRNLLNTAWSKLYQRGFLLENEIFFDETMVSAEDAKFVFQAVIAANVAYYANKILYRYHHDLKNGNDRLIRFPARVTHNSIMLYMLRREALSSSKIQALFTQKEIHALNIVVRDRVVRDLFETAGSFQIHELDYDCIKQLIQPLAAELYGEYCCDFSVATRIKCLFLARDWRFAIRLCAYLREIYIRVR